VNLAAGRVRVDVNPPVGTKTSMSVTSPSATASVRGTSLLMDLLNCKTLEGTVDYKQVQGLYSYLVKAGLIASVGPDGNVIDPVMSYLASLKPKPPAGSGTASGASQDGGDSASDNSTSEGNVSVGLLY